MSQWVMSQWVMGLGFAPVRYESGLNESWIDLVWGRIQNKISPKT